MKRRFIVIMSVIAMFIFVSCGRNFNNTQDSKITIACTTYPVYLLTQEFTKDIDDFDVVLVVDEQVSCLHNYTLNMSDIKKIEKADLLLINGAGMEDFLSDVLANYNYTDCSKNVDLIFNTEENEYDAHYWLEPSSYEIMAENICTALQKLDKNNYDFFSTRLEEIKSRLGILQEDLFNQTQSLKQRELITFHDGFNYFARAFDFDIAASVEEEEGSEASAKRIKELVEIIDKYNLKAVFVEVNGSTSAANALAMERNISVEKLSLGMSKDNIPSDLNGLDAYCWILTQNINAIVEAYK